MIWVEVSNAYKMLPIISTDIISMSEVIRNLYL